MSSSADLREPAVFNGPDTSDRLCRVTRSITTTRDSAGTALGSVSRGIGDRGDPSFGLLHHLLVARHAHRTGPQCFIAIAPPRVSVAAAVLMKTRPNVRVTDAPRQRFAPSSTTVGRIENNDYSPPIDIDQISRSSRSFSAVPSHGTRSIIQHSYPRIIIIIVVACLVCLLVIFLALCDRF